MRIQKTRNKKQRTKNEKDLPCKVKEGTKINKVGGQEKERKEQKMRKIYSDK